MSPTTTPALLPMSSAPKDGTFILLFSESGYGTTPHRAEICHYYPEYRPKNPWQNHANDAFSDGGGEPIGWLPLAGQQAEEEKPELVSFGALPLGSRFRYPGSKKVYVITQHRREHEDDEFMGGVIVDHIEDIEDYAVFRQGIYSHMPNDPDAGCPNMVEHVR